MTEGPTIRPLTEGERNLAASVFGSALDFEPVTVKRKKWFPFQPKNVLMAPTGHVHIHPASSHWSEDFSQERVQAQGWFLHELTHVWQTQHRGKYYLPLMRHAFCRYDYAVRANWPLERYGLEQQAEIVRHAFLLRHGVTIPGAPPLAVLESILPFRR
jgi:hypothetical protein